MRTKRSTNWATVPFKINQEKCYLSLFYLVYYLQNIQNTWEEMQNGQNVGEFGDFHGRK